MHVIVWKLYVNKFDLVKRFIEHLLDAELVNCEERMNNEEAVRTYRRNNRQGSHRTEKAGARSPDG